MVELKLPELGENIETAEVIRLLVREGDVIKADQNVMELESEKAAFPLPSTQAGKVAKVRVKEGEAVSVGQTLLEIEEAQGAETQKESTPPPTKRGEEPLESDSRELKDKGKPVSKAKPAREGDELKEGDGKAKKPAVHEGPAVERKAGADERQPLESRSQVSVPAGPATRRLARELGVDLSQLKGSEPGGRITREDVKAYVRDQKQGGPAAAPTPALPDFGRWGAVKRQRLSVLARTAAERLSLSWRTIPHVTQHELADLTELEAARERYNKNLSEGKPKITVTVLAVQAVVAALKVFPQFNSSLDAKAGELVVKEYYHIGVAVDTPHGLLVPVLRDADRKTVTELSQELAELADKARNRSLAREHMEGGTFTISNLGGIGGTYFTPIINYPEVAILGISRARWQRVARDEKFMRRLMLPLSLSYDHRVINGADGARFITKVAELLSGPFKLLAES
jgi:pyruvate dehydrogenase E2 component (dihydrolipoamide acetyltransferase)